MTCEQFHDLLVSPLKTRIEEEKKNHILNLPFSKLSTIVVLNDVCDASSV